MYCIKCGVELADSERVCPLCGTRVFHPDLPCGQGEPPYPPDGHPRHEEVSRIGVMFVVSVCTLLPAVISVLCDWRINGRITWSGFAVGGLVLLYILAALPMWFKRPDPVIFVPVDFAAIALFLLCMRGAAPLAYAAIPWVLDIPDEPDAQFYAWATQKSVAYLRFFLRMLPVIAIFILP